MSGSRTALLVKKKAAVPGRVRANPVAKPNSILDFKGLKAPSQIANARIIMREFLMAGLPTGVALAAVANAYGESLLNKDAVGDGGLAIGLFQIHPGKGRPDAAGRRDPATASRWIINDEVKTSAGNRLRSTAAAGGTVADLIRIFCEDIERPANASEKGWKRVEWARGFMGPLVDMPSTSLPYGWMLLPALLPWWMYAIGSTVAVGATAGAVWWATRE